MNVSLTRRNSTSSAGCQPAEIKGKHDRRSLTSNAGRDKSGFKSMLLEWLDARKARIGGTALADRIARQTGPRSAPGAEELLRRLAREIRTERLSFLRRAMFANAFRWRLIENGVSGELADELTERLLLLHSAGQRSSAQDGDSAAAPAARPPSGNPRDLLRRGNECAAGGGYTEAIAHYQNLLRRIPRHAEALNNLGAAYFQLGHNQEAEACFRQAMAVNPNFAEAHGNLGNVLRARGVIAEAENWLRRAVKLKPAYVDARNNLALTLVLRGRLQDATVHFRKVLKMTPDNADALFGMGHVAAMEGGFDEAGEMFQRALEVRPRMPSAWAGLARIRKMTSSDGEWLAGAEQIAAGGISPLEEAEIRFAMGKYCDDVKDFAKAFQNYKRANELTKTAATDYDRDVRAGFVADMIRVYSRKTISKLRGGGSPSTKPVFVVGMPRSGTSLIEQIIASHPAANGAGETTFWGDTANEHETSQWREPLAESARKGIAESYLRELGARSGDASRIVDKAPSNCDYLGLIYSVFPNARIIYSQRDPIDSCLSCYFQQFVTALNFTMDLSDLAHYFREHQRLMAHWRAVLPPGSILDVPYEALIADQESWTRKILEFLGLEWDERCLEFHKTKRPVVTSSFWHVRQKIYKESVARWRNYENFIEPLLSLRA